jgi:branched-chain amino acid transport system permease protein
MPYAQLSRVRMHYFEYGTGPELVVFVHGFQASARIWQLVQELLPADRYRTIAPNNRGAGETEAPSNEADFGVAPFAADLYELLAQLGWRDFTLVGHSMGGGTVTQFAIDHPDLLKGLLLLDPIDPDGMPGSSLMSAQQVERRVDRVGTQGEPRRATEAGSEFQRLLNADIAAAPERRLRGSMRSMLTIRLGEAAGALPMPVLLACGDADTTVPLPGMLASWAKFPKDTGLHVWHGVGHSPNVDIPAEVAALLRRFIEQTVPARLSTAATGATPAHS